jgi:hypothetical protein
VGNAWLLGSIADHYQYVVKQKTTKRRKVLLILSILCVAMGGFFGVGVGIFAAADVFSGATTAGSILSVAMMVVGYLGLMGLGIAVTVFCYIAYFDLFRSCRPEHDVLFLILGIFFGTAIFVFACSGYDKGMPERRVHQPAPQIPYVPQEPVCEEMPAEEIPVVETEIVEDSE